MFPDYDTPRPPRIGVCFTYRYAGAPLSDWESEHEAIERGELRGDDC